MINRAWVLTLLLCGCGSTAVLPASVSPLLSAAPVQTPAPPAAPDPVPVPPPVSPTPVLPAPPAPPVPPPGPQPVPAPTPVPLPPVPTPVPALIVTDPSVLNVTLSSGVIDIRLAGGQKESWMRLVLPDGSISTVTTGPNCECIGLSHGRLGVDVSFLPGLRIESADEKTGPWTLAAWTQATAAGVPGQPVTGPGLTLADTSLVTTELEAGTVMVKLANDEVGAWLRLILNNGSVSPITISPNCACIGLGGDGPHAVRFRALSGTRVEVSRLIEGPWTLAATIN